MRLAGSPPRSKRGANAWLDGDCFNSCVDKLNSQQVRLSAFFDPSEVFMPTPRQIRARIRTAKNIQQITKAMKMVAAAKLRRAQDSVASARPYAEKMRDVMSSLSSGISGGVNHPLLRPVSGEPRNIGVILITGDRGLCGAYNSGVIKKAIETIRPFGADRVKMICFGRRGIQFFRRRGYEIVADQGVPANGLSFAETQAISSQARELFAGGEIDALYLVYTKFISAISQRPQSIQLLPLSNEQGQGEAGASSTDYIFEPGAEEILSELLPRYVDTQVYQALLESVASFHGAQMTSMSSATDNAGKMISSYTLQLNRARQAAITKEIAEIVGGADALSG
jgi:F-type H+-transporting ATPase subunit gamma